jgi:predicted GNAT family acetyltransferase
MSDVTVNDGADRFETTIDGETAFLTFHRNGNRLVLIHTEVPEELGGEGLASLLAKTALQYARDNDLTVVPVCPFVQSYLERHPDEAAKTKLDLSRRA